VIVCAILHTSRQHREIKMKYKTIKNAKKPKWTCKLVNADYDTICIFKTRMVHHYDVLDLCARFKRLYKLNGKWIITK
jgi:hypothetical protein